jgi:hypothetical protein
LRGVAAGFAFAAVLDVQPAGHYHLHQQSGAGANDGNKAFAGDLRLLVETFRRQI